MTLVLNLKDVLDNCEKAIDEGRLAALYPEIDFIVYHYDTESHKPPRVPPNCGCALGVSIPLGKIREDQQTAKIHTISNIHLKDEDRDYIILLQKTHDDIINNRAAHQCVTSEKAQTIMRNIIQFIRDDKAKKTDVLK